MNERINKRVASASGLSRRKADEAIAAGRVSVNGKPAVPGQQVNDIDTITLDGAPLTAATKRQTIMLHKPAGYVVSRNGQGSRTIYDLLPASLHHLNPVGRLDKNSSGLLLLTNDGQLAERLTHPKYQKNKIYEVALDHSLQAEHKRQIEEGVQLEDGISKLALQPGKNDRAWTVTMHEGRNRQIRRTFAALGYDITRLHRTKFGDFELDKIGPGAWRKV